MLSLHDVETDLKKEAKKVSPDLIATLKPGPVCVLERSQNETHRSTTTIRQYTRCRSDGQDQNRSRSTGSGRHQSDLQCHPIHCFKWYVNLARYIRRLMCRCPKNHRPVRRLVRPTRGRHLCPSSRYRCPRPGSSRRGHAIVALCQRQRYRTWPQAKRAGYPVQAILTYVSSGNAIQR
jgi:hypothetical protein